MIAKLIKGKGFRGALEYALREDKGFLLDSNMAGQTPRELAREFGRIRALRSNLHKAVCHVSLALPPGESLSDDQWKEVGKIYLERMGFSNCQYVMARHTDAAHQHMHILANRVGLDGQVVSDSRDYCRQEEIMRQIERQYGLSPAPPSFDAQRKAFSKGEIEFSLRTGKPSARMRLRNIVDEVLQNPIGLDEFMRSLALNNVEVRLNQAATGKITGISFSSDGVALKGSDLGKGYTWNNLIKRGLINEQTGFNARHEHSNRKQEKGREYATTGRHDGNSDRYLGEAGKDQTGAERKDYHALESALRGIEGSKHERTPERSRGQGLSR